MLRRSQITSFFNKTLSSAGVTLKRDYTSHLINQEQSLVIRDLEKFLTEHETYPECVDVFINELKNLCKDKEFYTNTLQHTYLCKDGSGESTIETDSLFHIFLNVRSLQEDVMDMLLEQLIQYCCEETDVDNDGIVLIIKSLRDLPFIKNETTLTTKLVDAIEMAPLNIKIEILDHLSYIILDNQYDEMAKQLAKMLEEYENIAGPMIHCLNSFNLSLDARSNLQEYILERLLTNMRYYKIFPVLFKFLITNTAPENLNEILLKSRATLNNIMCEESEDLETVSNKLIIFKELEKLVLSKMFLFEGLTAMVTNFRVSSEHKPVDLLLLFVLHFCNKQKKKIIEGIFKRKVKAGLFKIGLFERLFRDFFVHEIFSNLFDSMLEIAGVFLHTGCVDIGSAIIKSLFLHEFSSHRHRHDILNRLNLVMCFNDKINFSVTLGIIKDLLKEPNMKGHIKQLMKLLEKIYGLSLKDCKDLFDILCYLTCRFDSNNTHSGFKDEIHNTVLKQLSSSERKMVQCGIVSAVTMTKYLTEVAEEQVSDSDLSVNNVSEILTEFSRDAATILLAGHKAAVNMDLLGLYYDELSTMVTSSENMELSFLDWLTKQITDEFQNNFVSENGDGSELINGIELSSQYCLNSVDEIESPMNVNIGHLVVNKNKLITVLSPIFRLLRILNYKQYHGDLNQISAVLGMPILLPKFEIIDDFNSQQLKQVTDCIFHCINWFREIISAFVKSPVKLVRIKVLQRLKHLIDLEDILKTCMSHVPGHILPVSYFDTTQGKKTSPMKTDSKSAKRFKPNPTTQNETIASTAEPKSKKKAIVKASYCYNYNFRDIDTDIIILLKYPLESTNSSPQIMSLNMKQFQFLLKDMIKKLDIVTKHKSMGLSPLTMVKAEDVIKDLSKYLPNVNKQADVITESIRKLLEANDDRDDLPEVYTEESNNIKLTFDHILELYLLIFTWGGFNQPKNDTLLEDCLKGFHHDKIAKTLNRLVNECVTWLNEKIKQCVYLPTAVNTIKIMQALYLIHPVDSINKTIVSASEKLLQKKWLNLSGNQETGKIAFENIEVLIKAYLKDADLDVICALVGTLEDEVDNLKRKDDYLMMLGSIDKTNLHIFYRELFTSLLNKTKDNNGLTNNEHLIFWRTTALTIQGLMSILKIHKTRTNIRSFMKKLVAILKVFLSQGIPILEIMLRSKPNEVVEVFKIMQSCTRFMNQLCCYTKVIKDSGLIALVPQFKLTLETMVYKVKALLVANNCSEAFWMGPLKNKGIDGAEISSQSTITSTEEEIEERDELSSDDSADDEGSNSNEKIPDESGSEMEDIV